jgi:excisionase family DNA binding protein
VAGKKKKLLKSNLAVTAPNPRQIEQPSALDFLKIEEARLFLRMGKSTLLKACRDHQITYYPGIGGKFLFKKADLIEYTERFRVEHRKSA